MSAGTFASLADARFRPGRCDDLALGADEQAFAVFVPAHRPGALVDRSLCDRVVMAVLGLAAFALVVTAP